MEAAARRRNRRRCWPRRLAGLAWLLGLATALTLLKFALFGTNFYPFGLKYRGWRLVRAAVDYAYPRWIDRRSREPWIRRLVVWDYDTPRNDVSYRHVAVTFDKPSWRPEAADPADLRVLEAFWTWRLGRSPAAWAAEPISDDYASDYPTTVWDLPLPQWLDFLDDGTLPAPRYRPWRELHVRAWLYREPKAPGGWSGHLTVFQEGRRHVRWDYNRRRLRVSQVKRSPAEAADDEPLRQFILRRAASLSSARREPATPPAESAMSPPARPADLAPEAE